MGATTGRRMYGYYSAEVNLQNAEKETEAGIPVRQDFSPPIGSKWRGGYELSVSLGRINDSTEVCADYLISIDRDSASFTAGGYKIYCSYQKIRPFVPLPKKHAGESKRANCNGKSDI